MIINNSDTSSSIKEYAKGTFCNNGSTYLVSGNRGSSMFGEMLMSYGSKYCVQLSPDGAGYTTIDDTPITSTDGLGKVLYIKDFESGEIWNPFYLPLCKFSDEYEVKYSPGKVTVQTLKNKIACSLTMTTVPEKCAELWTINLQNLSAKERCIGFIVYVDPCFEADTWAKYDEQTRTILTKKHCEDDNNPPSYKDKVIFLSSSLPSNAQIIPRSCYNGEGGDRVNLSKDIDKKPYDSEVIANDPLESFSLKIDLPIEGEADIVFCFGACESEEEALEISAEYTNSEKAASIVKLNAQAWSNLTSSCKIQTPDEVLNALINTWLPYEAYTNEISNTSIESLLNPWSIADELRGLCLLNQSNFEDSKTSLINFASRLSAYNSYSPDNKSIVTALPSESLWMAFCAYLYASETGNTNFLDSIINFNESATFTLLEHCEKAFHMCINTPTYNYSKNIISYVSQQNKLITRCHNYNESSIGVEDIYSKSNDDSELIKDSFGFLDHLMSISPTISDKKVMSIIQDYLQPGSQNISATHVACAVHLAITHNVFGIQPTFNGLKINPNIPDSWDECLITRNFRGNDYKIYITRNHKNKSSDLPMIIMDGEKINGNILPLMKDDNCHNVEVYL